MYSVSPVSPLYVRVLYSPTPTTFSPTQTRSSASGYTPRRWVVDTNVASPPRYTIPRGTGYTDLASSPGRTVPHGVMYTSLSIPSVGSSSVGYPSSTSSAPSTPRRVEQPSPHRALVISPSHPSPGGNTVLASRAISASTFAYHPATVRVPSLPSSPAPTAPPIGSPAAGSDYVAELGRASWKVMHAVAEQYPANPTHEDQQSALQFMYNFAKLYPCLKCRLHFQRVLQQLGPDVSSQPGFVAWMSAFHDRVNADLRKPQQ